MPLVAEQEGGGAAIRGPAPSKDWLGAKVRFAPKILTPLPKFAGPVVKIYAELLLSTLRYAKFFCLLIMQWRNDSPGAPATPGSAVSGGRQIVIKMWDNFARLTGKSARLV